MSTAIQWTDVTDNIIVAEGGGWWCRKISPGCLHCYAEKLNDSTYFQGNHLKYAGQPPKLKLRTEILDKWPRMRTPKKHFVASMTDIFGEWVPQQDIFTYLDAMRASPLQIFQCLTKRAAVMREQVGAWLQSRGLAEVPGNIWLGVSCEDQQRADERIPELLTIPAKVRFLSCEPLLAEIDLGKWVTEPTPFVVRILSKYYGKEGFDETASQPEKTLQVKKNHGLHWAIIGGESGKGARPCSVEWIRSLVAQCKAVGVAPFVKQLGADPVPEVTDPFTLLNLKDKKGGDQSEWPEDLRVRQFPTL